MANTVTITSNIEKWKKLAKLTAREFDAPETIRKVSIVLNRRFRLLARRSFESQGSSSGLAWPQLSEPYRTWKAKKYPGKTILRRKDRMYRSFTTKRFGVGFGSRTSAGFNYMYGSTVEYAKYHHEGRSPLPQRRVLQYTSQQLRGVTGAIARTIQQGIFSRAWFDDFKRDSIIPGFRNSGFDRIDL